MTIFINEDWLARAGCYSLTGVIVDKTGGPLPATLTLQFPESSLAFCEKNGGPFEFIIAEHVIPCLLDDILYLIAHHGVTIHIERIPR